MRAVQAVQNGADLRPLIGCHVARRWIVGAANAHDLVERANGVVVDRRPHADVIVVRADRDVCVAQRRIAAANDPDHIVRGCFRRCVDEAGAPTQRRSGRPDRELVEWRGEHRRRGGPCNGDDGQRRHTARARRVPIRLASNAICGRGAEVERREHDDAGACITTQVVPLPERECRCSKDDDLVAHEIRRDGRIANPAAVQDRNVLAAKSAPERLTAKREGEADLRDDEVIGAPSQGRPADPQHCGGVGCACDPGDLLQVGAVTPGRLEPEPFELARDVGR